MKDKVIFRVFKNGEVIALFPTHPATNDPYLCMSYMHVGQHGGANHHEVVKNTRLATAKEIAPLLLELRSVGYKHLEISKKFSKSDYQYRLDVIRAFN